MKRVAVHLRALVRRVWVLPLALSLCWCLLLLLLHAWTVRVEREHTMELACLQARTLHTQIVDTRAWNSAHGGVYVPETARARPNLWLPEAEQGLTAGDVRLVKINPAYMTRQIAEMASTTSARFRISSLTPVRVNNMADPWEGAALGALADGRAHTAVFELVPGPDGGEYRYLAPLYADAGCLSCHRDNHEGDIRGGISVTIAAAPILAASDERRRANSLAFAVLGFVGVSGIGGATWQMNRRRLQAEQANRAKSAFLAHIGHDMRTPLTGILGMLTRVETDCPAAARQLGCVRASAASLLDTVQGMMDHALNEEACLPDRHCVFSLRAALASCADAVRPACMAKGLNLETRFSTNIPDRLTGDPYRVRQVVGNLLGNAVKFTDRGSVILSAVCRTEGDGSRYLTVDVRDSGPGVDPADRECIFERFVQGETCCGPLTGRGLGLAIARQLARGMGGDVKLEHVPDGSLFRFTARFPAEEDGAGLGPAVRNEAEPKRDFSEFPLFDERAALEAMDGKADFLDGVCGVLRDELEERRTEVETAGRSARSDLMLGHVHALKNSAAALGCERLRACSLALENTLRGGRPDDDLASVWLRVVEQTREALAAYVGRQGGAGASVCAAPVIMQEDTTHGPRFDRG